MVGHSESAVENDTKVSDGVLYRTRVEMIETSLMSILSSCWPEPSHIACVLEGLRREFAAAKPVMDVSQTHSDNLLTAAAA